MTEEAVVNDLKALYAENSAEISEDTQISAEREKEFTKPDPFYRSPKEFCLLELSAIIDDITVSSRTRASAKKKIADILDRHFLKPEEVGSEEREAFAREIQAYQNDVAVLKNTIVSMAVLQHTRMM